MTPEQARAAFEAQVMGELMGVVVIVVALMLAWRYWDQMQLFEQQPEEQDSTDRAEVK